MRRRRAGARRCPGRAAGGTDLRRGQKLLLKARRPSIGLRLLREWGLLPAVAPRAESLIDTPQDPEWHLGATSGSHAPGRGPGRAAWLEGHAPRAHAVMLDTLVSRSGQASDDADDGRPAALCAPTRRRDCQPQNALLDRWNVHRLHGYDVRARVLGLVGNHLKPGQFYDDRERVGAGAIRRLARKCEPALLYRVAAPIAWDERVTSRPWPWSGSWSGSMPSKSRSGRPTRFSWDAMCWSWA